MSEFRSRFLDYDGVTRQLEAWAKAHPGLVSVSSIGTTAEGRDLWLLTIDADPSRPKPAVWVDGNMHAAELCGSSVALAIAEDVIRLHAGDGATLHGLPPHAAAVVRGVRFYVLPRVSPDGAECVLKQGRFVRSNPRDRRPDTARPRWLEGDVDGDGRVLSMRVEDPSGEFVEAPGARGLLVPRQLEDEGPFYRLYPEGTIANFDGVHVPDPSYLSDNDTDLNRNFPWSWTPEPEQYGAGAFALSEPESRAIVEFTTAHPEIFAWLNLHTFGGCFIRPLGNAPDKKMHGFDRALFRQIGAWAETIVGYPMVSGYEEFLYEPDKPLHGDLADYAYHQRGAIAFVCELWDLFRELGVERVKPFVDHYARLTRADLARFAAWDAEKNAGRAVQPWTRFRHPQLGDVEIGGLDRRVGVQNPPYERVGELCTKLSALLLRVAALAPRVTIEEPVVEPLGGGTSRLRVVVANHGYLPTYVLGSAKDLAHGTPLYVEARGEGCELDQAAAPRAIGHLEGWGRGLFADAHSLFAMKSKGRSREVAEYVVRGRGKVHVRVSGCRTGAVERTIEIA